jgi:hypothetical protein
MEGGREEMRKQGESPHYIISDVVHMINPLWDIAFNHLQCYSFSQLHHTGAGLDSTASSTFVVVFQVVT